MSDGLNCGDSCVEQQISDDLNPEIDRKSYEFKSYFLKNLIKYLNPGKTLTEKLEIPNEIQGKDFIRFDSLISNVFKPIENHLKQSILELIISFNISDDCFQSLIKIIEDIKQQKFWAFECKYLLCKK